MPKRALDINVGNLSFELLFQAMPVACLLCDTQGNILLANPSAQLLLHETGELHDKNIQQLMPELTTPDLIKNATAQELQYSILFRSAARYLNVQCVPIHHNAHDYLLVVISSDRRKQAEQALQNILQAAVPNADGMSEQVKLAALTEREREVMSLAVAGYHNKEIARALGISHRTVEIHKSRIMHKTGASNLLDLARMASAVQLPARS